MPDGTAEFKLHEAFTDPGAEEYKKKGNEAFKEQKWDEAIKNYNKAIALDPKQAAFYSNRAACWSSKSNHESALADANKCIECDPSFVKGYSRKGKALFDLKNFDEAEAAYQEGLVVDTSNDACLRGLADVKAARQQAQSSSFGLGSASGLLNSLVEKLKKGGMGGRLQIYMVLMAGYFLYNKFMKDPSRSSSASSRGDLGHETASEDDSDVMESSADAPQIRRVFKQVGSTWLSYLEIENRAETALLLLHRTSLSAEAEFSEFLIPQLQDKVAAAAWPGGLRLIAPDRPCHGYSPCARSGEPPANNDWLRGLLAAWQVPKQLAVVACGQEATLEALRFLGKRRQPAKVLLISSLDAPPSHGAMDSAADIASWLAKHHGATSATASADAASWAARGAAASAAAQDEATASSSEITGEKALAEAAGKLPKGTSVMMLHAAGRDEENQALKQALEETGVEVASRVAGQEGGPSFAQEVLSEVHQLLGVASDEPAEDN